MRRILKKYFIPHKGNRYHPHILHTKRAILYSLVALLIKTGMLFFAILIPAQAFLLPDVLAEESGKISSLTNSLRRDKGLAPLTQVGKLEASATAKARDMAELGYFSHTGPHGHTLAYFLNRAGYQYQVAGENLAMGFTDAESVVDAWVKSPAHYANLVDHDYKELGIGLESGMYRGEQTVYVAQHFGEPFKPAQSAPVLTNKSPSLVRLTLADKQPLASRGTTKVQGEKVASSTLPSQAGEAEILFYDKGTSHVYWLEDTGATVLTVRAHITGPVVSAVVAVNNYPIDLIRLSPTSTEFRGTLTVAAAPETFFHPVIVPTITVVGASGERIQDTIDWFNIKVPEGTPIQKYVQAKKTLSPLTHFFTVSRAVYIVFVIFFAVALGLNIFIEIKRQHYHIIVQTLLLIALLLLLWWA